MSRYQEEGFCIKRSPDGNRGRLPKLTAYEKNLIVFILVYISTN